MAELKLVVGADVKEAEQALRGLVVSIDKTTASIQKFSADVSSFGKAPLHNIQNISKAFLELKKDLSNVKFAAIPPVTADIRPAQLALKSLSDEAKKTGVAVASISDSAEKVNAEINRTLGDISAVPPIKIDVSPAKQSLKVLTSDIDQTADAVRNLSSDINNSLKKAAVPAIEANVAPAQQSLRTLADEIKKTTSSVTGISTFFDKFSTDVNKSLGALSLSSLNNFKKAFADFRNDLSNVKVSALPPVTVDTTLARQSLQSLAVNVDRTIDGIRADLQNVKVAAIPPVSIDTEPAERELKELVTTVNSTLVSFRQIGSDINKSFGALPFNIEKFRQAFIDFKQDLSDVKISQIPPVTIDTRPAENSLKVLTANVDQTVDAIKADLNNVKISTLPPIGVDIRPAQASLRNLVDEAKITGTSISGISTDVERFSASVRKSLGALPLHNVEAFRQAFLNFKADLSTITISKIPPLKVDIGAAQQSLQKIAQEADKTGVSVSNVSTAFQRFSQNIARDFGALPLSSIAAFRQAFLNFKSDLSNVKISTIPPVKVDVSQASNSLQSLDGIVEDSIGTLNSLASAYARWSAQADASSDVAANSLRNVNVALGSIEGTAKKSFGAIVVNFDQTGAAVNRFGNDLNKSVGVLPIQRVEELRQAFIRLKADLSNVQITTIPPITADARPAQEALKNLTVEAKKSGEAVTGVSTAFGKLNQQVSGLNNTGIKQAEQATASFVRVVNSSGAATDKLGDNLSLLQRQVSSFGGGVRTFSSTFSRSFGSLPGSIKKVDSALDRLPDSSNAATLSLLNLGRVVQDAPFGFLGIANNLNPLLEGFQRLKGSTGSTSAAIKALGSAFLGPAGIGVAISAVSSLLIVFGDKLFQSSKKTQEAAEQLKKYKETVEGIFQSTAKEATQVASLIGLLKNETETRERKLIAIKELQKIQPEVFKNLILEGNAVVGLDTAYQNYLKNLKTVIAVKIKQAQLENKITELLKRQGVEQTSRERKLFDLSKFEKFNKELANTFVDPDDAAGQFFRNLSVEAAKAGDALSQEVDGLIGDISELSKGINLSADTTKKSGDTLKDFIARAKQLNDELEKIGFIPPVKFSFFDTFDEELAKAKKVFDDFNSKNLKINPKVFTFPSFSEPEIKEKVDRALDIVREGIRSGVIGLPKIPIGVNVEFSEVTDFSQNTELIREFKDRFSNLSKILPTVDMEMAAGFNRSVFVDSIREFFRLSSDVTQEEALKFADKIEGAINQMGAGISAAVESIAVGGLTGIGEAIGAALAGEDVGNAFKVFASVIADGIAAIGKEYLKFGAAAILAKKSLKFLILKPELAIAAGIALLAAAASLRSALNKGVTGFAHGGLVFGPTVGLIGEGVGTSRSNPEVVAPLDQLKKMLGDVGPSPQVVIVRGVLRGKDQILQNARTNRSQRRLG